MTKNSEDDDSMVEINDTPFFIVGMKAPMGYDYLAYTSEGSTPDKDILMIDTVGIRNDDHPDFFEKLKNLKILHYVFISSKTDTEYRFHIVSPMYHTLRGYHEVHKIIYPYGSMHHLYHSYIEGHKRQSRVLATLRFTEKGRAPAPYFDKHYDLTMRPRDKPWNCLNDYSKDHYKFFEYLAGDKKSYEDVRIALNIVPVKIR